MAKLTDRTALAETPADGDLIHVVDISDTTDDAAGTSKKITRANLVGGLAVSGGAEHDGFSDFVANEHIDWTQDQGATNIHSGNIPDLSATYLTDVVSDTTPQLGGDLDAQGNNITALGDVTFKTGAAGGTLRTGTSAADKFQLQAYDVDGTAYTLLMEADAGNTPILQLIADHLRIEDAADPTKQVKLDLTGITTATTRTWTVPDSDLDFANLPSSAEKTVLGNTSGTNTGDEVAADTTTAGVVEIATSAEINTGTDNGRAVSPDGLAGSNLGTKVLEVTAFDYTTDTAVGDGAGYVTVPSSYAGMDLVAVHARVITAGTTGTTDVQIHNLTQTADMLTTKLTIDSAETGSDTAATAAVIDTANDDVAAYDLLRIDVDAVSTTAAKGLIVTMEFRLP